MFTQFVTSGVFLVLLVSAVNVNAAMLNELSNQSPTKEITLLAQSDSISHIGWAGDGITDVYGYHDYTEE